MKELNFGFEQKQIKVNGHVFDVVMSDAEILEKTTALTKKYNALKDRADVQTVEGTEEIIEAVNEAIELTDRMLGEGAMRKITGGKPVGLVESVEAMSAIARTIVEMYSEHVKSEFALDGDGKPALKAVKTKK